ncbi:MBOAT family protein, partial [bacterium]|nr:MBOAT family protein [bacterium]
MSLIFISTVTDYLCGIQIHNHRNPQGKRKFLCISIIVNLTLLGFFKYWDFFVDSFIALLSTIGIHGNVATLHIILPVGISFYTFQTMTYSIDIYRGKIEPTHNFFDFALFVSFFPQLVAGPIERAKNLLPQIHNKRHFDKDQMFRGFHLIFWGLFKKVFVADNLGIIIDQVYANPAA